MNTLLLCPALFSSHGGIERILRLYLKALCELAAPADRVALATLNDPALTPAQLAPYATAALGPVVASGRAKIRFTLRTLLLARHCDRLVCGHINLLPVAQLARRVNSRLTTTLVAHGIEVWRNFSRSEQRALRATRAILCVSDYTRRELLARCPGLAPAQLHVQPNALDPEFEVRYDDLTSAVPATGAPGLILTVARLSSADAYKGVDHLIEALPAIRAHVSNARLRIVGDGDDRPRLEALAARLGVTSAVEFTGRVTDAALRDHFASCQLFALPSRAEGFGLVYLEAFAHGKPCLAADAGGAPEVISPISGMLVPYGDVPAIAQACRQALRNTWDRRAILIRAQQFSFTAFKTRLAPLLGA